MELVKELVKKAMPLLSNDLMDLLMARLEVIGVNSVDDLNFVRIEDVDGILPPIQCRRLIQAFSVGKSIGVCVQFFFQRKCCYQSKVMNRFVYTFPRLLTKIMCVSNFKN